MRNREATGIQEKTHESSCDEAAAYNREVISLAVESFSGVSAPDLGTEVSVLTQLAVF